MKQKIAAVVNFVYFLANYSGSFNEVINTIWADDKNLANHLNAKIASVEIFNIGEIINWFFGLSAGNQSIFVEWIEKNYHHNSEHRDQPWQLTLTVPVQKIKDALITALEGGSNYWYYLPDVEMARKEEYKGMSLSEKVLNAVIDHNEVIPVHDIENINDKLGEISRENIERGFKLFVEYNEFDAGMDAFEADTLFQLIVIGEVVYG